MTEQSFARSSAARARGKSERLTRDEERALLERWFQHKDRRALDRLVAAHQPLVRRIARSCAAASVALDDLIQEGNVGLIIAASRFDPTYENRFASYATWWIEMRVRLFCAHNVSLVRRPVSGARRRIVSMIDAQRRSDVARPNETRSMVLARVAEMNGIEFARVEEVELARALPDDSLSDPIGRDDGERDEGQMLLDRLADTRPDPEDAVIRKVDRARCATWLVDAFLQLPDRERLIVMDRLFRRDSKTLRELAEAFGVSAERVRQLEARATRQIAAALGERVMAVRAQLAGDLDLVRGDGRAVM